MLAVLVVMHAWGRQNLVNPKAPGCVNGSSDFSLQHTFVDNCYRFCHTVLIYWTCRFPYNFISYGCVESGNQFLLKYLKFCPVFLEYSVVLLLSKLKPTVSVLSIFPQTR